MSTSYGPHNNQKGKRKQKTKTKQENRYEGGSVAEWLERRIGKP